MRTVLILLLLVGPLYAPPCEVRVTRQPAVPPACELHDLSGGTVFTDPMGRLFMVVVPVRPLEVWGHTSHVLHGVRQQPSRVATVVPYFVPGYGHFTIELPGPVYVVDLADGTLALMRRDTWARPVVKASVSATMAPE